MEEKNYTLKQLYAYVTEYSREAREEGFDMSVGDFVDWVASRDEKGQSIQDHDSGIWSCAECAFINSHSPECKDQSLVINLGKPSEEEDKPVLPQKPNIPMIVMYENETERKLGEMILEIANVQSELIDYL